MLTRLLARFLFALPTALRQSLILSMLSAPVAMAAPSTLLASPDDFSADHVLITFEGLGLAYGSPVPPLSGVAFTLSDGSPAPYNIDFYTREFGPTLIGSIANFAGFSFPFPDLWLTFPELVHRVSFELRASPLEDIQVSLLSSGVVVDKLTFPSRGSDMLYFYGFENVAGFDEVLVDVTEDPLLMTGDFSLDNLRFESFEVVDPGPETFSCIGITSFPELVLSDSVPIVELKGHLIDPADGTFVTGEMLLVPPMARVVFSRAAGDPAIDVSVDVLAVTGDRFAPTSEGAWQLDLMTETMREAGTYTITMQTPDELDYMIAPTCETQLVRMPPEAPIPDEGTDDGELKHDRHNHHKHHKHHKMHSKHNSHKKHKKHRRHEKHRKHGKSWK